MKTVLFPLVILLFSTFSVAKVVTPIASISDVFKTSKVSPKKGQTIVFLGNRLFIGDSLIMEIGRIAAIHELFPESKIR